MLTNPVYRAIVAYSSSATGEIKVRIPALTGISDVTPISKVGRTAYNGIWPVPSIGSQIVVTADDDHLNNVFWVQVAPDAPTSLAPIQAQIDGQQNQIDGQQTQIDGQQTQIDGQQTQVDGQQTQVDDQQNQIDYMYGLSNSQQNQISYTQNVTRMQQDQLLELESYRDALMLKVFS